MTTLPLQATDYTSDSATRRAIYLTCENATVNIYTILGKFEKEGWILETDISGRKRTYRITGHGLEAYREELNRLRQCIADAEQEDPFDLPGGGTKALPEL